MPRGPREKSESGIYHVMLRGIDKRKIFLSDEDCEKFLDNVEKAMEKSEFTIYGYCLMGNHVHLLIKTGTEDIGDTVKRIAVGYVQYFNIKYGRTGHLFQNRFRSEPVDDDLYFRTVLRYIHQNPVKAGIVKKLSDYKWSSYREYFMNKNRLIDTSLAMEYFGGRETFEKYMMEENDDECLEYRENIRYTDDELKEVISSFTDISELKNLDKKSRDEILKAIKENTNVSNRQLSRVLGINRNIIDNIKYHK
ncbi:MAG: Y1-Tnp domain-containing protein [Sporanaerobacter sp.]|jgi:putative transposase|uniref:REP-associated tyrosine transposase n=1 Tax=Sporanaerobacter sp. TaxID=2010183 RepID=UPI003A0FC38C